MTEEWLEKTLSPAHYVSPREVEIDFKLEYTLTVTSQAI